MTFFDWSDSNENTVVSKYFWIYVVMTLLLTFGTLGIWWYFGVRRPLRRSKLSKNGLDRIV